MSKAKQPAPRQAAKKPASKSASNQSASKKSASKSKSIELTGYSASFSFEEAIRDALTQAAAAFPAPPRNPDVGVRVEVKTISALTGGNMRPGLSVVVKAG